jgi:hypothetical protein
VHLDRSKRFERKFLGNMLLDRCDVLVAHLVEDNAMDAEAAGDGWFTRTGGCSIGTGECAGSAEGPHRELIQACHRACKRADLTLALGLHSWLIIRSLVKECFAASSTKAHSFCREPGATRKALGVPNVSSKRIGGLYISCLGGFEDFVDDTFCFCWMAKLNNSCKSRASRRRFSP